MRSELTLVWLYSLPLAPVLRSLPPTVKLVDPAVHVVTAATQELDLLGLMNTHATTDLALVSGCPQQFAQSSAVARLHTSEVRALSRCNKSQGATGISLDKGNLLLALF